MECIVSELFPNLRLLLPTASSSPASQCFLSTRLLKHCGTVSTNIDTTYTQDVEGGFSELDRGRLHDLIR